MQTISQVRRPCGRVANGRQLTWEYPRATLDGDQIDLVEVMNVVGGLITHHRVYWGWVGFKTLGAK
jgi:steroid Delta-isomerase